MDTGLWINPVGGRIRVDSDGDGHYGTRRLRQGVSVPGGHHGIDLLCEPAQKVLSPIDCLVFRDGRVYADSPLFNLVVLRAPEGVELKLMYVQPRTEILGLHVKAGDVIAIAQDVRERYPSATSMQPHVHVELRKNGNLMNPTPFFFA